MPLSIAQDASEPSSAVSIPKESCDAPGAIAGGVFEGPEIYGEDYYLHGVERGLSNYENYRWCPDLTLPMASHVARFLDMRSGDRVLSFGCARGYDVKAFRMLGYKAQGYDISKWAIENCDPGVKGFVSNEMPRSPWDILYMKDCAEHIHPDELLIALPQLLNLTMRRALLIVPLARKTGGEYLNPLDERDVTHINRWTLHDWIVFLEKMDSSFVVSGSYRVPLLKASSEHYPCSCGFLTLQRI